MFQEVEGVPLPSKAEIRAMFAQLIGGSLMAKKTAVFLLEKSENLSKPVCVSFDPGEVTGIIFSEKSIQDASCRRINTKLDDFLHHTLHKPMRLYWLPGHYEEGQFKMLSGGMTIWLGMEHDNYSDNAELVKASVEEISQISVKE